MGGIKRKTSPCPPDWEGLGMVWDTGTPKLWAPELWAPEVEESIPLEHSRPTMEAAEERLG